MVSITLGIILFIIGGLLLSRGRGFSKSVRIVMQVLTVVLFCYLTLVLGLHWYISGHAPLVGTYSVMMLMAWLTTIAMTALRRSLPIIQPMGFILAGFTMLVASLSFADPEVQNLAPVLNSPLLGVHVLCMMVSYTLFGLVALTGVMGLVQKKQESQSMLRDVSLTILYPAVFILTIGTFIGAVWANISWGSYWSWDPKETWSLVTWLIYAVYLHLRIFAKWKGRPAAIFAIAGFIAVIFTYIGVNTFLPGVHSYK